MPLATFQDDVVEIQNVRNFRHQDDQTMNVAYYDAEVDLAEIATVDLFISLFQNELSPIAHTMLSFGNRQRDQFLTVSIEARREVGEEFNFVTASTGQLELIYVVADERDIIDQRAVVRGEKVLRFPLQLTQANARGLFASLLREANQLRQRPQLYDLLENNCTTNLVRQADYTTIGPVDRMTLTAFPAYADITLRRVGLIAPTRDGVAERSRAEINSLAALYRDSAHYSRRIRGE